MFAFANNNIPLKLHYITDNKEPLCIQIIQHFNTNCKRANYAFAQLDTGNHGA